MLLSTRWYKVIRDLWQDRERSFLVILAISLGVFAITVVSSSYAVLTRTTDVNYMNTNPASATLWVDSLDNELVQKVRNLPTIAEAEARRRARARFLVGDEWITLWLFVVQDFDDLRVSTFQPEAGQWPPKDGDILIERNALETYNLVIGDPIQVITQNGSQKGVVVAGSVHDPGLEQAWMEGVAYGYISLATYEELGEVPTLDQLKIIVAENSLDKDHIVRITNQTKTWLEENGKPIYRVEVPPPGEHPHRRPIGGLMYLLQVLSLLSLILSGVLVANVISALLAQQIRQIGIMKAIGAKTGQVMGVYFGSVLVLGLVALMLAMPISLLAARAYTTFAAGLLNFDLVWQIPLWVYALQIIVSLLVPLLVAAYPVYKGSRVTVREAVNDYGIGQGKFGSRSLDILLSRIGGLLRPILLSIRNTFRRQGRVVFTIITLAIGGAVLMAMMNIRTSISKTLNEVYTDQFFNNIELGLVQSYPVDQIEQAASENPDVAGIETWINIRGAMVYRDGTESNHFRIVAPTAASKLLNASNATLIEGRWLQPDDENTVVLSHLFLSEVSDARVGDEIVFNLDGKMTTWKVVGIVRQVMVEATAYVNPDFFLETTGWQKGYANNVHVITRNSDDRSQDTTLASLEKQFKDAGIRISWNLKPAAYREAIEDHMLMITNFLILMAILAIVVGGLGLVTTMSINVMERRREIGVMRAVGASTKVLLQIFVVEGGLIGFLSWLVTPLLAIPFSIIIGNSFGNVMLGTYLDFAFAPLGLGIWLAIVVVFAGAASFHPAWNAAQISVREVLAYE